MSDASPELRRSVGGAHEPYRALLRDVAAAARDDARVRSRTLLEARRATLGPTPAAPATPGNRRSSKRGRVRRAAAALSPLAPRDRQRHHRRRPLDRRAPPHGGLRPDARAARRAAGGGAAHRGDRRDHARARPGRVRELAGGRGASTSCVNVLDARRSADAGRLAANPRVAEVLDTFRMMAAIHPESLGAYVITMAGRPSDVLAVELLQREAGVTSAAPRGAALRDGARPARRRRR